MVFELLFFNCVTVQPKNMKTWQVLANATLGVTLRNIPNLFMLRNQDKLHADGPLGSYADFNLPEILALIG